MSERKLLLDSYLLNQGEAELILKKNGYSFINTDLIWQILIYEFDHRDIPTEVFFERLSTDQIVNTIVSYYHKFGIPEGDVWAWDIDVFEFGDDIIKATVKIDNNKWVIHANDADPYPSSPHAHQYQSGFKLHLGTGDLYDKKRVVGHISKKDLKEIRKTIRLKLPDLTLPKANVD